MIRSSSNSSPVLTKNIAHTHPNLTVVPIPTPRTITVISYANIISHNRLSCTRKSFIKIIDFSLIFVLVLLFIYLFLLFMNILSSICSSNVLANASWNLFHSFFILLLFSCNYLFLHSFHFNIFFLPLFFAFTCIYNCCVCFTVPSLHFFYCFECAKCINLCVHDDRKGNWTF